MIARRNLLGILVRAKAAHIALMSVDCGVKPVVLVHGGAGDIPDSRVQLKMDGTKRAAREGYRTLRTTGCVLDAVVAAIKVMEDDEAFNAGRGSVLNLEGEVEMEASITEGRNLNAGSVSIVKNIKNPIELARRVMEDTPHTILGAQGAADFAKKACVQVASDDYLITEYAKQALEAFKKKGGTPLMTELGPSNGGDVGTVGVVVVDANGHVASGTSTGGINGKMRGRIGDTPLPGSGGYSDDHIGAVSTTGHGESILKYNLAHRILSAIQQGKSAEAATKLGVEGMTSRMGQTAGAITVDNKGDVGVAFTANRMAWAYQVEDEVHFGVDQGQHCVETL